MDYMENLTLILFVNRRVGRVSDLQRTGHSGDGPLL